MSAAATQLSLWFAVLTLVAGPIAFPPFGHLLSLLVRIVWLYFVTGARG